MEKIGFIGAYDKTDLIVYIAKILVEMGKTVLLVDGTITQKAKYVIPSIKPSKSYVTEFEGIDIAVGFAKIEQIKQYLGIPTNIDLTYDYILVDADNPIIVENFGLETAKKNYFVTSFDLYSIKRGLEALCQIRNPINATKVLFSKEALKEEDDYLNFLSLGTRVVWEEERIYFPFEVGDQTVIYNNQRVSKIKLKGLSVQYKEQLMYMIGQLMENNSNETYNEIRKIFKKIEKGV